MDFVEKWEKCCLMLEGIICVNIIGLFCVCWSYKILEEICVFKF